ncbi:hypothetical protein PIB30_011072 [Stylosanthes scabra]|uniref:DUF3511 domain protein n=1 Tax=Stylosanthes scabra TaxID=79078 RepID=A0ABU6X416_9FABA|nr:hypothetical protein [Stylosanthes scabra]
MANQGCFSPSPEIKPRLKKQRSKNIFKVVLSKMRGRSEKPKELQQVDDDGPHHNNNKSSSWRKLVGSMRTLQMQNVDSSSPARTFRTPNTMQSPSETNDNDAFHSFPNSPMSQFSPMSSRYSSAEGLNRLVENDERNKGTRKERGDDDDDDHSDGDDMIDANVEEFIADFYLQMKLQKLNVMDPHYRRIMNSRCGEDGSAVKVAVPAYQEVEGQWFGKESVEGSYGRRRTTWRRGELVEARRVGTRREKMVESRLYMEGYGSDQCGGGSSRPEIVSGKACYCYGTDMAANPSELTRASHNGAATVAKPWSFGDPESRRRKRIARYKVYAVEGRVKEYVRNGIRWIKNQCSRIVHGC